MFRLAIGIIGIILMLLALYIAVIVSLILFDSKVDIKRYSNEINPVPFHQNQPSVPFLHNQPPMPFHQNQPPMPFQQNPMPMTPKDWKWNEQMFEKEKKDRRSSIEWTVEDFDKFISELKLEQKILDNQLEIDISHLELEIDYLTKQKDKLK